MKIVDRINRIKRRPINHHACTPDVNIRAIKNRVNSTSPLVVLAELAIVVSDESFPSDDVTVVFPATVPLVVSWSSSNLGASDADIIARDAIFSKPEIFLLTPRIRKQELRSQFSVNLDVSPSMSGRLCRLIDQGVTYRRPSFQWLECALCTTIRFHAWPTKSALYEYTRGRRKMFSFG